MPTILTKVPSIRAFPPDISFNVQVVDVIIPDKSGIPYLKTTERFFSFVSAEDIAIAVDTTGTPIPIATSVRAEPAAKSLDLSKYSEPSC